jgi:rare lipoprotein A (peptidoglycan hydrolase)
MSPRARRMVPGMLASLLLAAPLAAPHAQAEGLDPAAAVSPRKAMEHRRPAARHKQALRRRSPPLHVTHTVAFYDDSPAPGVPGWHQSGIASWYGGPRWQGKPTASGTRYDQDALTAAHATLPLGSHVRVALEGSNRSVIVTINDRPGTRTRIIDLSRGAASALGILDRGIARVTLSTP